MDGQESGQVCVTPVTRELLPAFLDYCRRHGAEHDDSYTGDADLKPIEDELGEENPSVVLLSLDGSVVGAASAMLSPRVCAPGRGRFRILHCTEPDVERYRAMLDALAAATEGTAAGVRGREMYLFVPETATPVRAILEQLGFAVERVSYGLRASNTSVGMPELPAGFFLRPLRHGEDEQAWCDIVNDAFAHLAGHTHLVPEAVAETAFAEDSMPEGEGRLMLWCEGSSAVPIGLVEVRRFTDDGEHVAQIGPIAVRGGWQGRGFGRLLLRAAVAAARQAGFENSWLSVNGENERAIGLYLSEGFRKVQAMVCYSRRLG